MKNVRVFYRKKGRLKYISHLDMNRVFSRIARRSGIPLWYTEGFNPHPKLNFALPLSLGFESDYEAVDIRVEDDSFTSEQAYDMLAPVMPDGLELVSVKEPVMKVGDIAYAQFDLCMKVPAEVESFFDLEVIEIEKLNKKKQIKKVDIKPMIKQWTVTDTGLSLLLSAGVDNLNPTAVIKAMEDFFGYEISVTNVVRGMLYNKEMKKFE